MRDISHKIGQPGRSCIKPGSRSIQCDAQPMRHHKDAYLRTINRSARSWRARRVFMLVVRLARTAILGAALVGMETAIVAAQPYLPAPTGGDPFVTIPALTGTSGSLPMIPQFGFSGTFTYPTNNAPASTSAEFLMDSQTVPNPPPSPALPSGNIVSISVFSLLHRRRPRSSSMAPLRLH